MNLSYQQLQARLQTALNDADASLKTQEYGYLYVQDLWSDKVVYGSFDGKSYQRSYVVADDGTVTLGDRSEVIPQTIYIPVPGDTVASTFTFSKDDDPAGRKRFSGKLFEEGDYGSKGKYDKAKLKSLVDGFPENGVFVKDTHASTFLGKCMEEDGTKVLRTWIVDKEQSGVVRREIHGEIDAPAWVAEATRNRTKSMSIGLTPDASAITEVSLALTPHVEDAAVFHRDAIAFSASPTFTAFAAAHPDAARLVTEAAKAPVPPETMPLTKEQKIEEAKKAYPNLPQFMRDKQTEAEFVAFSIGEASPTTKTEPTEADRRLAAAEERLAEFARDKDERDDAEAAKTFCADLMDDPKGSKIAPYEKETVIAGFKAARAADRSKAVTFSANAEGSHEAAFRKTFESRTATFSKGPNRLPSDAKIDLSSEANPILDHYKSKEKKD
jgi:hypothetical protein